MTNDEIGKLVAEQRDIERLHAQHAEAEKWRRMTEGPLKALGGREGIRALQAEVAAQRVVEAAFGRDILQRSQTVASVIRDLNRQGEFARQIQDIVNGASVLQRAVPEAAKQVRAILDAGALVRDSYARQIADAVTAARLVHENAARNAAQHLRDISLAAEAARAVATSVLTMREQIEQTLSAANFGKQVRDTLAALDVGRQLHESMIAAVRRADFARSLDSIRALAETAASLSPERWPELYQETDSLEIDATGSLRMGARTISQSELQAVVSGVVDRSISASNTQLGDQLANLIAEIRKLKDPWYEKLLVHFVLPLLIAIIVAFATPLAERYVADDRKADERNLKKLIRQEVTATVRREQLSAFRFVTATLLHVRAKGSSKSAVVGTLRFGQTVQLIQKDGDWSLIEWIGEDEDGAMMRGWVFSRYLGKFH